MNGLNEKNLLLQEVVSQFWIRSLPINLFEGCKSRKNTVQFVAKRPTNVLFLSINIIVCNLHRNVDKPLASTVREALET
jgi:hypothetical protein